MKECPECAGTGVCCAHDPCHQCNGAKVVPMNINYEVKATEEGKTLKQVILKAFRLGIDR